MDNKLNLPEFEEIFLGPTPNAEKCAQVGTSNYTVLTNMEIQAYMFQLRRQFTNMPSSIALYKKANPHDFGTYYELVARFPIDDEDAMEYACRMEENLPDRWDEEAIFELKKKNYFECLQ